MGNWHCKCLLAVVLVLTAYPVMAMTKSLSAQSNPLLKDWRTPFGVPPFEQIKADHFLPAFREAIARHKQEIAAIAANPEAPTFDNTVLALEASGRLLTKVDDVFGNLVRAETNDRLQAINREVAPMRSAHLDDMVFDERLFERIRALWDRRDELALDPEQDMLLERTWKRFVRGGARLDGASKTRLRDINAALAALGLQFTDNVLQEMNRYRLVVERRDDLAGLPDQAVTAAAETAEQAGMKAKWVFTLHHPSLWPFLKNAGNRELRRKIFTAYTTRGNHDNATDNKATLAPIAALRAEKARLLGYGTWADYVLEEHMAKTPASVY
ncbi:MAG: M3 family metallopeptidase, partial [Gammaproteobacteria bacterium]